MWWHGGIANDEKRSSSCCRIGSHQRRHIGRCPKNETINSTSVGIWNGGRQQTTEKCHEQVQGMFSIWLSAHSSLDCSLSHLLAWLIYREGFGRAIIRLSDWWIDWLIDRCLFEWNLYMYRECELLYWNLGDFISNNLFMFVLACWKRFRYGVLVHQRIGKRRAARWGGGKRRQGRAGSEAHWTPRQAAWFPTGSLHYSSRRRSSVVWGKGPSLVPESAAGWDWPVHPTVAGEICRRGTAGRHGHAGWLAQTDWGKHSSDAETCLCVAGGCADDPGRECHAVSHVAGTRNFFKSAVVHFANQSINRPIECPSKQAFIHSFNQSINHLMKWSVGTVKLLFPSLFSL